VSRHLAIGDIHGCINALTSLVDFVALRPDDTIVTLGDYVDRGPDSSAVLDFVIGLGKTQNLVLLRCNHEIMMLDSREKKSWFHAWMGYGGDATLLSYSRSEEDSGSFADVPDAHIDFLENKLMPYYECETHFFVHANRWKTRRTPHFIGGGTTIRNRIAPEKSWSAAILFNYPAFLAATVIRFVLTPGHAEAAG